MNNLVNIILKLFSLGGKFILIFVILNKFGHNVIGQYSLVQAYVLVVMSVIGLELYQLTLREVMQNIFALRNLKNQYILNIYGYCTIIMFSIIYMILTSNDVIFISLIVAILILEHISMEFYRTFIALKFLFVANILLFIKSGLWAYVVSAVILSNLIVINNPIILILLFWNIFLLISILYAFISSNKKILKIIISSKYNKTYLIKGVKKSLLYVFIGISLKLLEFNCRFILDFLYTEHEVGIFSFNQTMASLTNIILVTGFLSVKYSDIVKLNPMNMASYKEKVLKKTIFYSIMSSIFVIVILELYSIIFNYDLIYIYLLFSLCAYFFLNLSIMNYYFLYALHADILIIKIMLFSVVLSLIIIYILILNFRVLGAEIGFLISYLILFIILRYKTNMTIKEKEKNNAYFFSK